MISFRDARKIQPRREVTVTARRVAVMVVVQGLLVGGAFAGGYYLRTQPPSWAGAGAGAQGPLARADPLEGLDAGDKRVDYTYEQILTQPRMKLDTPPTLEKVAPAATRPRAAAQRSERPARTRMAMAPSAPATRAAPARADSDPAVRSPRAGGTTDDVDDLAARMLRIARQSVRSGASRDVAPRATTDDELLQAMGRPARRAGAKAGPSPLARSSREEQ